MNFGFSEDQDMIRKSARDFVERDSSLERVRALADDAIGYSPEHLSKIAESGWLAAVYPEECGGIGLGCADLICITEEFGRGLIPEPLISSIAAGSVILHAGTDEQKTTILPDVAEGSLKITLAAYELAGRFNTAHVETVATETGGGYILNGEKAFVPDAEAADKILVTARISGDRADRSGISVFLIDRDAPGVTRVPISSMDRRSRATVQLNEVTVSDDARIGDAGAALDGVEKAIDLATVALCGESVGIMEQALKMTIEYAQERVQFGKPIGSFQAVKHKAANMYVSVEMARSSLYYAAMAVDNDLPDLRAAVSAAKAICGDAVLAVTKEAIQLHGGIGFTDEHNIHLFFKRGQVIAVTYGDAMYHRERYAQEKGLRDPSAAAANMESVGAV